MKKNMSELNFKKGNLIIFISGAMTGVDNYQEKFNEAEAFLREKFGKNVEIMNPAKIEIQYPENWSVNMKREESLRKLAKANAIYFLDNWENSPGANREYGYGVAKGMLMMFQEPFV